MDKHSVKKPNLAGLNSYRRQGGRGCKVCASPHRRFVEQAAKAGHSKRAIHEYLATEFGVQLPTNLGHHLLNHVKAKA